MLIPKMPVKVIMISLSPHTARDKHLKKPTLYFWPQWFFFGHLLYPTLYERNIYPLTALHCSAIYCSLLRHAQTYEIPGSSCPSVLTGLFLCKKNIQLKKKEKMRVKLENQSKIWRAQKYILCKKESGQKILLKLENLIIIKTLCSFFC